MATTAVIPPIVAAGESQATVSLHSERGKLLPIVAKDLVLTLAAAVKYLERASNTRLLLATPCKRVRSMHPLGCTASRRGYVPRPTLGNQAGVGKLLVELLKTQNVARPSGNGRDRSLMSLVFSQRGMPHGKDSLSIKAFGDGSSSPDNEPC